MKENAQKMLIIECFSEGNNPTSAVIGTTEEPLSKILLTPIGN